MALLHMPWALTRHQVTYLGMSHQVPKTPRVPSGSVSHSLASPWSHLGSQGDSFTCDQVRNNPGRAWSLLPLGEAYFLDILVSAFRALQFFMSPHVPHNCCLSPGGQIPTSRLFSPLSSPLPPFVGFLSLLSVSLFVKSGFLFLFFFFELLLKISLGQRDCARCWLTAWSRSKLPDALAFACGWSSTSVMSPLCDS